MLKKLKVFNSFEEQEMYFLNYFFNLTPSERLKALGDLQLKNYKNFNKNVVKKITIKKHFLDGHSE